MTSYLRPDEQSSQTRSQASNERDKKYKTGVKSAVSIASTVAGVGAAHKILPFLSSFIPFDLALKGISKVSPKIGDFLKRGMESGLDAKEGLEFLRQGLSNGEKQQQDPYQPILDKTKQIQERLANLGNEVDQRSQQQNQKSGQGDAALLAQLDKILKM